MTGQHVHTCDDHGTLLCAGAIEWAVIVDLVAFVDLEHEVATNGCHYEPGKDCYDWCDACKLLARVPADVVAEARRVLRERGVERD